MNEERLGKVLEEWRGTPYRHWSGVKQGGADCIHFVMRVYEELGLLRLRKGMVRWYPKDWHLHNSGELLLEGVHGSGLFDEVAGFKDGDMVLFRIGKTVSHSAVLYKEWLYHSLNDIGVVRSSFKEFCSKHKLVTGFRPKCP